MAQIKPIRTERDHEAALARIDELIGAPSNSPEADELDVLMVLVEKYEEPRFEISAPTPVEALRFRMEQQGLKAADLIPYFGTRARVSEILAGKRQITLKMARALHKGLGIPAEAFLNDKDEEGSSAIADIEADKFPLPEMAKRGWLGKISASASELRTRSEEIVKAYISSACPTGVCPALYRQGGVRSGVEMDSYAMMAWRAQVIKTALQDPLMQPYDPTVVNEDFVRECIKLSWSKQGPSLAREFLREHGMHFVVLRHLPRTHLDGAAMMYDGRPIIALTLRYDRLDNFWYVLAHELAHVAKHLNSGEDVSFFDDLDLHDGLSDREREADAFATEALIPKEIWENAAARHTGNPKDVNSLAKQLRIDPSIIAGRLRFETKNYRLLTNLIGHGEVRKHFPNAEMGQ